MLKDAAMVTVSCVLFIQMGLSDAIQRVLGVKFAIASCPKCLTMWTCFAVLLAHGYGFLESAAASFASAYCALWLALIHDALAVAYNNIYETISEKSGTDKDSAQESACADADSDAVS